MPHTTISIKGGQNAISEQRKMDENWKEIVKQFFQHALEKFIPELAEDLDTSREEGVRRIQETEKQGGKNNANKRGRREGH